MNWFAFRVERLLRWSERYFKTDMVYLSSGGFWLVFSQAVSVAGGLALAVAFAHLIPKETYGYYRFVLAAAGLLALTNLSGLNTALTRAVAQGSFDSYVPIFAERVRWGALGALGALILALYYGLQANVVLAGGFAVAAAFLAFTDPLNVYEAFRQGTRDFRYNALADSVVRVGSVLALIGTMLLSHNVWFIIGAYFAGNALFQFPFFLGTKRESARRAAAAPADTRSVIAYGRHLSVLYIISAVAAQIDSIVIFHFAGAVAVAVYAFATAVPDQARALIKNLAVLAYPKFAARPLDDIWRGLANKTFTLGIAALFMALAYVALAPYLFALLFPAYMDAVPVTQVLIFGIVDVLTLLPLSALKAHEKTRELYAYNVVTSVVQIACIALGGLEAGLWGVVYGVLAGRVFAVLYLHALVRVLAKRRA